MPIKAGLGLPIERTNLSGPAVKALENRREDNNSKKASVKKFQKAHSPVKATNLTALRELASKKF
jgi:hypothetical protein